MKVVKQAVQGNANSKFGTVGTLDDGTKYVLFTRRLPHPIETVWAAITDPEELARWFPGIQLECREGGAFSIWFSEACEGPAHLTGTVTVYDPPNVLALGTMRWELVADEEDCVVTFTDVLAFGDTTNKFDFTNSVLAGWHKYVDMLEYALAGGTGDPRQEPEFDYSTITVTGRDQNTI